MNDERWRIDVVSHSGSGTKIYAGLTGCGRSGNGWMGIAVDIPPQIGQILPYLQNERGVAEPAAPLLPRICRSNRSRQLELILKNSSDFAFLGLNLQNERSK